MLSRDYKQRMPFSTEKKVIFHLLERVHLAEYYYFSLLCVGEKTGKSQI